jgi:hypothetical protein
MLAKTLVPLLLAGCSTGILGSGAPATQQTTQSGETGAKMSVSLGTDTDVVGFHFEVESKACHPGASYEDFFYAENVELDQTVFPGRIEFLEDAPFDGDSAHQGADFFIALDPGCYTVTATPVSSIHGDDFEASCDCSTAKSDKLEVEGGYTTEVTLISQCEGDLVGAIDALVMTNTPPTVVPDIENKFNNQCETVQICATGWDPDDDPIEFDFTNLTKGHDFFDVDVGDIELVGYESGHRLWQQCAGIVTEDIADYTVEITAYDLAYDEDGNEVRIEDLIDMDSHGWFQVPIHTGWTMSDSCIMRDGSVCTDEGDVYPGCSVISDEEMYCSGEYDIDPAIVALICDGTDLIEDELYPTCTGK